MTPGEVVEALIETGACYQLQMNRQKPSMFGEDYSQLGYNEESDDATDTTGWQVVEDKKELHKFNQWLLAMTKPTEPIGKFDGPMLACCILKRRLYVQGDDIPHGLKALQLKFDCEHIKNIRMAENSNVMLVETTFGTTGIMIPKRASMMD